MLFHADLHIHSKFSRATSKASDLRGMALWARRKGVRVVGCGDITHPSWVDELKTHLIPAAPGLFKLNTLISDPIDIPHASEVMFMLTGEISTIYRWQGKVRKGHHVVVLPNFDVVGRLNQRLKRVGNLAADGRPILALDARDLLEIVLEVGASEGAFLFPAHIWTPWFSVLGARSGFDSIDDCYRDLSHHIFAVETGLSSNPAMNRRLTQLDRFSLVSFSDAHAPQRIGRETTLFSCDLDFWQIRHALSSGEGLAGTVEFFPEEGKYYLNGHRKCGIRWTPEESLAHNHRCPVCDKPVTVGVLYRVECLADRMDGVSDRDLPFYSLLSLPEIMAQVLGFKTTQGKQVQSAYLGLLQKLGPELSILLDQPLDRIAALGSEKLSVAIKRMRCGDVRCEAGYDGLFGRVHL
ncbi:endonuclease Q family protein [Magnetococcales bacterium HHB-1]